jgi:hypothetical protein
MNSVVNTLAEGRDTVRDYLPEGDWGKRLATVLGFYLLVIIGLSIYWSILPAQFDVEEHTQTLLAEHGGDVVTGSVTMGSLTGVMETLLDKPGGYLHNDRFPPGVWLDNVPNWEYGVLIQSRDLARAMREVFSRSQSQSMEDPDLAIAEPNFNFNSDSWMLPATESEYREGLKFARNYLRRLSEKESPSAQFYARSDNLSYWLSAVESRLGSLSQRLSASVGRSRINTDLAGDAAASQSTDTPSEDVVKTPWMEIDDVFFEARGTTWALIHFLKAAEIDFADVLRKKNAQVSLRQIIRELEATQETVWSPLILNGSGFGPLANHSLVMAGYISRANTAIIELRTLLSQG